MIFSKHFFKFLIISFLLAGSLFSLTAESKKSILVTTLSGLKIESSYTNAFFMKSMEDYSQNSVGANLGFEYSLLPSFVKNLDIGFYGKTGFQHFFPYNIQLISLESYSFSGGLFSQYQLPKDLALKYSIGCGFLISELEFMSSEKGEIKDVYYDFLFEMDLNLRKSLIKAKYLDFLLDTGCHFTYYNEKTKDFCSLGPTFGLILDFKPCRSLR